MIGHDQIRGIVSERLGKRFPRLKVISINVRDDLDEDGEQIVDVDVVIQDRDGDFDPTRISAFRREVVSELNKAEETRFPVFSFISKSDLGNRKPEAA